MPPALVEMTPPMVAVPSAARLSGNRRSAAVAACCASSRVIPASTVMASSSGVTSRTARSFRVESRTSPKGIWPPTRPVSPPWGTMAMWCSAQTRTAAATWAVERGVSISGVWPCQRLRHSVSQGAISAGSSVQPPSPRTDFRAARAAGEAAVMEALSQSHGRGERAKPRWSDDRSPPLPRPRRRRRLSAR